MQIIRHAKSGNRDLYIFSQLELEACDGEFESIELCTSIKTVVRMRLNIEYEPTFDILEWETNFTGNYATFSILIHFYICCCIKVLY